MTSSKTNVVTHADLETWLTQIFMAAGMSREDAGDIARNLAQAELRGVTSHGLQLVPVYLQRIREGGIRTNYELRVLVDTPNRYVLDADGAPGQVATRQMVEATVGRAARAGVAHGAVVNSNHAGMLATYAMDAAGTGAVVLLMTTTGPSIHGPDGVGPSIGNNALCLAAPCKNHEPLVFDMATGIVACGKIRYAALTGETIPQVWLTAADGRPTSDPRDLDRNGAVPSAGAHKGFGLTVLVDVLAALLVDAPPSPSVGRQRRDPERPTRASQACVALFPDPALGGGSLAARVCAYAEHLRSMPARDPACPVLAPGDPELDAVRRAAERGGIEIPAEVQKIVEDACVAHGLHLLPPFASNIR